jgi:TonB family protein
MRLFLNGALSLLFISSTALAQSPGISVWAISEIGTAMPKEISGTVPGSKPGAKVTRTVKKGVIIELRGKFSYVSGSSASTAKLALTGIKLSGLAEKGGKSWTTEPIAIGFDTAGGCVDYRFLDSKGTATISQSINGETVEVEVKDGKPSATSGIPLPLCLAFPAANSPRRKILAFAGTEVWFESNGVRPHPISRYSVFVDETAMTPRLISHPEPQYPALAKTARIAGSVVLSVTVAGDGRVSDVQVYSQDNPLLSTGVVDTIRTWQYQPTLLGNVPVEVRTRVTVTFQ